MNQQEHINKARELLERAHQESTGGGDDLLAAEMMWGAFCHCLITVALNNGLPHDSHGAFRHVAQQLDATGRRNTWRTRFGAAERLHRHFYHGDVPAKLLQAYMQRASNATQELLNTL